MKGTARTWLMGLFALGAACGDLGRSRTFVVQIVADDAVREAIDEAMEAVRGEAARRHVAFAVARPDSPDTFEIEMGEAAGVPIMRDVLRGRLAAGWTVAEEARGRFVVHLDEAQARAIRERAIAEAVAVLERRARRVAWLPLSSARVVPAHGGFADRVRVNLPASVDVESAKHLLTTRSRLELKAVEEILPQGQEQPGSGVPPGLEVLRGPAESPGETISYVVRRAPLITDRDIQNARMGLASDNQPDIQFTLTSAAAQTFRRETGALVGRQLAIVLDGRIYSAPVVQGPIGRDGVITGQFTRGEAETIAQMLRSGALPARVTLLEVIEPR